jgi:hypothetical protein
VETLSAYLHSRPNLVDIDSRIKQRVRDEGADALAWQARDRWPRLASDLARDYGVTPPADLDDATLKTELQNLERHGLPHFHAVRRYLERQADAIEYTEGRTAAATPTRQTPGSDYGPAGWNAGIGDPNGMSCYEFGVLLGGLAVLELFAELSGIGRPLLAVLTFGFAIACNPMEA